MNEEELLKRDKTICMFGGSVECFADRDSDRQNVRLKLYDGGISKHWYWGNLAFDLKSMKVAKKTTPILIDHDTSQRAGVGTRVIKDDGFTLEGRFLKSSIVAQEVREQSAEGYPFEASLRFDLLAANITQVDENATHKVNGQVLEGPGTVIYNAKVLEGSIVTFGALANCATEVFDNILQKGQKMSKEMEMTLDTFRADHTELYDKVFSMGKAEGEKSERDLFAAIAKECPDAALASTCFIEGKSPDEARDAFKDAEIARLKKEKEEALKMVKERSVDPAVQEFLDASDAHAEPKSQVPDTEDGWREEFKRSNELRTEFGEHGIEAYIAFRKAERDGRCKILSNR